MLFNKKLDPNLKYMIDNDIYNRYRIIIKYGTIKNSIEKKIKSSKGEILYNIKSLHCLCVLANKKSIKRIIELPEVKYICIDDIAFLCNKNILHANGIFLDNKRFEMLKNRDISGKGIGIGIIDSGVYPHIDLSTPSNKVKKFIDVINGSTYPYDDNGHGTFISGLICGEGTNKKAKQRGIAVDSHLVMVKAFNKLGKGYISATLFALECLYNNIDEFNIKIICAPFEIITLNKFILSLYDKIFTMFRNKNIIIVVPAGNNEDKEDTIRGIALSDKVLTIGGIDTDSTYRISDYSCCGSNKTLKKPDFVAASDDIISLNTDCNYISERDGERIYPTPLASPYTIRSGTSISCAFIVGICALLFEINNDFTFDDIYTLLKINSILINDKKYKQGNGYINISNLLGTDLASIVNNTANKNKHKHKK
ncbi:S8 family serine peptidase [Clostridium sp.]|uniref:S8 family serine peptidase n=1 Tax=Clostridium sp. TaxID=1506 RepID=UPI00321780DD